MKLRTSLKNNFSLQLVTFMAAIFCLVFGRAMQVEAGPNSIKDLSPPSNDRLQHVINPQLIAQWSELNTQDLSLATGDRDSYSLYDEAQAKLFVTQLNPEPQLIAQIWSEIDIQELSLATNEPKNNLSANLAPQQLLVTQLNPEQSQLIAQVWSESAINTQKLSLAPNKSPADALASDVAPQQLLATQLNPKPQLIAQVWLKVNTQELSLAANNNFNAIASQVDTKLAIARFNPQQQIISQNWTELDTQNLSLAEPDNNFNFVPSAIETVEPSQPQPDPIINPPDKREIAARLALEQVRIVSPAPGVILDKNHNDSVTIQYPSNTAVKLQVNGTELDDSLVTQQQLDKKRNLITQTWEGAKLRNGENIISAIATTDGFDRETTREVMVRDTSSVASSLKNPAATASNSPSDSNVNESSSPENSADKPQTNKDRVKILAPQDNAILDTIHSSVIIQYPQDASVILQLNGDSIDTLQVGRSEVNSQTQEITQTWYGIIFRSGVNTLSVLATTDGVNYQETSIRVVVPGKPKSLKVETEETEIPADGRSITTVKGEFVDKYGTITPWNETITLKSSEGKFVGADLEPDVPGFQVKPIDGEFTAELQAGYDAEMVTIRAATSKFESYTQVRFKTTLREIPLLTGFADFRFGARGTNFYDSYRDFLPLDEDNGAELDFTTAGYIAGSFGKWSYTGAFNSDRGIDEEDDRRDRIFRRYGSSEPEYPVYGDESSTEVTTPSTDNVYLRLERNPQVEFADPDFFMWGDYSTDEFSTESQEFTAVSRQLHGFKSNYNLGNFQLNALYANDIEGFQRDAIAPDGTSGFYFLSRRLIIPGSEDVYVELSPLNEPGNVVYRQRLSFGTDYEIDYDRGTLLFSDPVLSTEVDDNGNILVRRIVATYQFESEGDSNLIAGRGRYHFNRDPERPSWVGGSYINEDGGDRDFSLWGFDGYLSLGDWGDITGEYARSNNETVFAEASGSAYRFEGEARFTSKIYGRAYYEKTEEGFANDATLSFIPGQTRYGTQVQAQVTDSTNLRAAYEHQDNEGVAPRPLDELEEFLELGTAPVPGSILDNTLDSITAGVEQQIGNADLGVDLIWRQRSDNRNPETLDTTSTQLRSRFQIPITERINFHTFNDLTLSDNTDAVYSDRLGFGLDWEILSGLSLVLNQQWFTKGDLAGESLTSIGLQGEYEPWTNGTISARYNLNSSADGIGNVGAIGLQQKLAIAPGLDVDLNYENTFNGFDSTDSGVRFSQPYAVGQSTSALGFGSGSTYSVGITYSDNPNFTADAQWQYSDRNNGGNTVWSAGITGKLTSALTALLDYNQASSANQTFDIGTTRNLRLGLAYRDLQRDNFNALLRYEYEEDGGIIPETLLLGEGTGTQEHLFGLEAIYSPSWRWEFYGKYAFRNSKTFISNDFVGDSHISLGQLRVTYRLNYHFDLVAEGRTIWQPSANYTETGYLLEAGYYLTPEIRLSGGYVFGSADDEDFTGTRSAGGPYVGMTLKLNSLLDGFGQHRAPTLPEGVTEAEEIEKSKD